MSEQQAGNRPVTPAWAAVATAVGVALIVGMALAIVAMACLNIAKEIIRKAIR